MRVNRAWPMLVVLLGSGCGALPDRQQVSDAVPGLPEAATLISGTGFDSMPAAPDAEGPSLRLALGGRRTYARLLQESGDRRLWRSAGGVVVATEGARVVATSGLSQVLAGTRFDSLDPLADPRALLARSFTARRQLDLMTRSRNPDGMRFGVLLTCRLRARPLPEDAATLLVEENCRSAALESFTNRFWVEAGSGAVLRSEQWVGPGLPHLWLEEVSPASAALPAASGG